MEIIVVLEIILRCEFLKIVRRVNVNELDFPLERLGQTIKGKKIVPLDYKIVFIGNMLDLMFSILVILLETGQSLRFHKTVYLIGAQEFHSRILPAFLRPL